MTLGSRARARNVLLTLAAGACLGCSEQTALAPVLAAASSHFSTFERFERWAVRSVASDVRLEGTNALREMLFAPLRRERSVAWAEVQWGPGQALAYRTPLADDALSFVPIEAPALGRVLVALCASCEQAEKKSECVVIERPAKQRPVRVRMAFCKVEKLEKEVQARAAKPKERHSQMSRALIPPAPAPPPAPEDRRRERRERVRGDVVSR